MRHHLDRLQDEEEPDFGTFLKLLRTQKRVRQGTIAALLADKGWTPTTYTRLENGAIAPRFSDLLPLYRAFVFAGVAFSLTDRQQFVQRARTKIERKKTHREQHSDAEWAELRYELARLDGLPDIVPTMTMPTSARVVQKPLLTDTAHLLGREQWREGLLACVQGPVRKKLIVMQGPAGIGKSSELHWLATAFLRHSPTTHHVMLCDLRSLGHTSRPEDAFNVFVYTLLVELGFPPAPTSMLSLDDLAQQVLEQLEKARLPLLVLLDHAECLLQESGSLAPCWERLFTAFLRVQHSSTLVLTSQQWPGWYQGERQFLVECSLPPLSRETSLLVLQQHGLDSVPVTVLEHIYERVGGIPLALEWVAAMVKQPLEMEDWAEFGESMSGASADRDSMTGSIERLLNEPHIFGGTLADDIAPLLQRIIATQHFSPEARALLEVLAVSRIPLAKPALQLLCPQGPRPLKELRRASVLVSYPDRIQLLPMVAAAMYRQLNAEQRKERESTLIGACQAWINQGTLHEQEQAVAITELATLLLKHHRLIEVEEHLIYYGWVSFNHGYGPRLARLAEQVMQQFDWHETLEMECVGLLLQKTLYPFLGKTTDDIWCEHSRRILTAFLKREIKLPLGAEYALMHRLMLQTMNELHFEEAQTILDAYYVCLEARQIPHLDQHTSLLCERALLVGTWCEYAEEQGDMQKARELRELVIALYRQYSNILLAGAEKALSTLKTSLHRRKLAYSYNYLAFELGRSGQFEEALEFIDRSIVLKEQGYARFNGLAAAYGDKSQILMELGRFQEALYFDEKAFTEIQRCAETGDALSKNEVWIYYVYRGRLYLRLGRIEEAESLLREALPHIRPGRRMYRMFARQALEEIEQWRKQATAPEHQLDWRWLARFRELVAYDGHGWLAHAGPFTEEEQHQWDCLFVPHADEATREQVATLMVQSRERELQAALTEQREPRLRYPGIDIEEVRRRIVGLLQLDTEISQQEPNAIVRRLYHGAIEYDLDFLYLIEATYEGNTDAFWACNLRLLTVPTAEDVEFALLPIKHMVLQGLKRPEAMEVARQLKEFIEVSLHLSLDVPPDTEEIEQIYSNGQKSPPSPIISVQAARKFFETALREGGCNGWRVEIDPKALHPRVEGGLRTFFLSRGPFWLDDVRYWFVHELAGHIGRNVAGEHSPLGLLGISTKNYQPTEEGFNYYHECQIERLQGQEPRRPKMWMGTISTGLASGVITPPLTFRTLYTFLELYGLLNQLLRRPNVDIQNARQSAKTVALRRCLRTFRGVPNLERAGVCYLQDAVYLHGTRLIEQAVAEDKMVLDRLAVGKVSLEVLPDLQELGIVSTPQFLRQLAYDPDLDAHILSFEQAEEQVSG
ncbi:MAG TPA: helix-turn-helix domain-containing protein [Ktedonobacteraceae bacterium]|nr:helix-turn-helix domain-containing protein [Ktedonobacteraceae bacterium]